MTYEALLKDARTKLEAAGITDATTDAWYMLSAASGLANANFIAKFPEEVPADIADAFAALLKRRIAHEPVQLILGETEFMGLRIKLDGTTLIPRPDTERLVECAMEYWHERYEKGDKLSALDLGTGSGCIAIALAYYGRFEKVDASDVSAEAINCARANAALGKVDINFMCSDLFAGIEGTYDMIVSNPPYIKTGDIDGLMPEVKNYDPITALDGGEDGLDYYRSIASEAAAHLNDNGALFLEIGFDQGADVKGLLESAGFKEIKIIQDYGGNDRVVSARK